MKNRLMNATTRYLAGSNVTNYRFEEQFDIGHEFSASIPLILDLSIKDNSVKRAELLFMEFFSGGMMCGARLLQY